MSEVVPRKGMPSVQIDADTFRARFFAQYSDPAYGRATAEITGCARLPGTPIARDAKRRERCLRARGLLNLPTSSLLIGSPPAPVSKQPRSTHHRTRLCGWLRRMVVLAA
jgi:hypothetical protein